MLNLIITIVVIISSIWVYLDATKNKIGKIKDEKGLFNMSAGAWALVTLLLWIVGMPAYLIKRKSLIEKAEDHPVETSGRVIKILGLLLIGILMIIGQLSKIDVNDINISSKENNEVSCTDHNVQELVMDIIQEEIIKNMLPQFIMANSMNILNELNNYLENLPESEKSNPLVDNNSITYLLMAASSNGENVNMPMDEFIKITKVSNTAKEIYDKIQQEINNTNLSLTGIRILKKEPELKKITCAADVSMEGGRSFPINYSAQITEDDRIYVEALFQ